ncbi:AAA family ATPase [Clostridium sp. D2Q-11]|uniref:endopeptidase La n=1 Tax=Anaeromonas frigoriresistens TaxID=2683708 RepID=A0A942UV83_9FIRM|nr:ATP-binding protein [Anaeromonas frigoriresistens]MBS4537424.1 AAA family ATPase [Anaeromonas frigoriresistens]
MDNYKISINQLKKECDLSLFDFNTTEEVEDWEGLIGQERAMEALKFGLSINRKGYNIYVSGLTGTGRNSYSYSLAKEFSKDKGKCKDWCYVYNFIKPESPKSVGLEKGQGIILKKELEKLITSLQNEIPKVLSSKTHEEKIDDIYKEYEFIIEKTVDELNKTAIEYNFEFEYIDGGLVTYPLVDGKPMSKQQLEKLDSESIKLLKEESSKLQSDTFDTIKKLKNEENNLSNKIEKLNKEIVKQTIEFNINPIKSILSSNEEVIRYLDEVKTDIIENYEKFKEEESEDNQLKLLQKKVDDKDFFTRYEVNLFIDNSNLNGGPVIKEINPNYYNLLGKIEYINQLGVLKTDHTRIKPGAIHEANGGYLIVQAKDILKSPYVWEGLKRCLMSDEIRIENVSKESLISESLRPEAIPLDIKIIIIGDYYLYQLLYTNDDDFKKLFRIRADFDVEMKRTEENMMLIAKFVSHHCKKDDLLPFDKKSIGKIVEYSSKLAEDQRKLTCRFNYIVELLYEADALGRSEKSSIVTEYHIEKALQHKMYRNNKYETKLHELFEDETLLLQTNGYEIGQINGLAVMDSGQYSFGRPNKITVSTFVGEDGIISIEREVDQSGSSYDKGVLILNGYIGDKFAKDRPLSLSASITFEQSYDIIDGDSASSTELYALLSSLSEIPINQAIAVTGSINQKGKIQPIGGANEKIEGYFKVCKAKGFNGDEGVIIPYQNVNNLMLSQEVIEAVKNGVFTIYSIKNVDEGIEILTGMSAGKLNEEGNYPKDTIYYFVEKKLDSFAQYNKEYE